MTFSVDLGKKLDSLLEEMVSAGRYNSKSEILREGVRLVHERESRLAQLDAAVARGIADADAGRTIASADLLKELEARYQQDGGSDE